MKTSNPHQNLPTYWFRTVFTCKQCLICAYFSLDSDKTIYIMAILWIEDSYFSRKQQFEAKNVLMVLFLTNTQLFTSQDVNWWPGLEWCGLLVDYCDAFLSCLDSHSDGAHSLQRIHYWASDVMLHFSKSVQLKKQTHLHLGLDGLRGWVNFQQMLIFGWTIPLES